MSARADHGLGEQRASEATIRALIETWAAAVRAGDLDGVLTDNADDIQMFDVPPPRAEVGDPALGESRGARFRPCE